MIPYNKPYLSGNELKYINEAVNSGHISGNGDFTKKCHVFFENRYHFNKVLLTTSCTDALEMAAILLDIQPEDEVIIPSFTFVSTANAFVLRGAKIIFADSEAESPNIDADCIEELITAKTKAIVVVHYAGVACNMDKIMEVASKHNLFVIEDAAQAINSFYKGSIPLGSIGHLAAFSFHETKNIISGEGGMLVINHKEFNKRAEIIWEKGTNRTAFFRGETNKYCWTDIGSSFLPSDTTAAFLLAQLENLDSIQEKRIKIWFQYYQELKDLQIFGLIKLPVVHDYATNNGHIFYFLCENSDSRDSLLSYLKENGILAVFHYLPLHSSEFYKSKYTGRELKRCDQYSSSIIRLPLFAELTPVQVSYVTDTIHRYFESYT
jgi:dTDP-4-amino-4,6-dideoxygalactose transaminase